MEKTISQLHNPNPAEPAQKDGLGPAPGGLPALECRDNRLAIARKRWRAKDRERGKPNPSTRFRFTEDIHPRLQ